MTVGRHRILVSATRMWSTCLLIEDRLRVAVTRRHLGGTQWELTFDAPKDVDLDFLRPDVLPPR